MTLRCCVQTFQYVGDDDGGGGDEEEEDDDDDDDDCSCDTKLY